MAVSASAEVVTLTRTMSATTMSGGRRAAGSCCHACCIPSSCVDQLADVFSMPASTGSNCAAMHKGPK
eukprot:6252264-Prymnesium_polylepis.1